jgi:hypothetical protein
MQEEEERHVGTSNHMSIKDEGTFMEISSSYVPLPGSQLDPFSSNTKDK